MNRLTLTTLLLSLSPCLVIAAPVTHNSMGMAKIKQKSEYIVPAQKDWRNDTGFGKLTPEVQMMTLMMVGGSGMKGMSMGSMSMKPGMAMGGSSMSDMKMGSGSMPAEKSGGYHFSAAIKPNPPIVGKNLVILKITDGKGEGVTGLKLKASVAMTAMDMGTTTPRVVEGKQGSYSLTADFAMQGKWRVTITGKSPDGGRQIDKSLLFDAGSKKMWMASSSMLTLKSSAIEKVGSSRLEFTLQDASGKPVSNAKLSAVVAMQTMDMGTTHPSVTHESKGDYLVTVNLAMAGPWVITLHAVIPGQEPVTKSFVVTAKGG